MMIKSNQILFLPPSQVLYCTVLYRIVSYPRFSLATPIHQCISPLTGRLTDRDQPVGNKLKARFRRPKTQRPKDPSTRTVHTCMNACLITCLSVCLLTCLPTCLHTCLSACLSAYLPTYLLTYLPTCLPACLPACLVPPLAPARTVHAI